ncbi:hypothetical protein EBR21_15150, partial [bacterium]|nr:hypothetical protein [bacterium]
YLEQLQKLKSHKGSLDLTKAADEIAHQIFTTTGLLLNNATWTGLPSHLRFVVSIEEADFERALGKLRDFDANWQCPTQ